MEKLEKLLVAEAHDTHPSAVCKVHVAAWLWSFGASSPGEVCTPCACSTLLQEPVLLALLHLKTAVG